MCQNKETKAFIFLVREKGSSSDYSILLKPGADSYFEAVSEPHIAQAMISQCLLAHAFDINIERVEIKDKEDLKKILDHSQKSLLVDFNCIGLSNDGSGSGSVLFLPTEKGNGRMVVAKK